MTWHAKATGGYSPTSQEAYDNAVEIYNTLSYFGWTRQAICGMLGNSDHEGQLNPWRWESDDVLSTTQWRYWTDPSRGGNSAGYNDKDSSGRFLSPSRHGYGMLGFTPADKYLTLHQEVTSLGNFAPNFSNQAGRPVDGYAQCWYVDKYGEWSRGRLADALPVVWSVQEYSRLTYDVGLMAALWAWGYEGPWWTTDPEYAEVYPNRYSIERSNSAIYWNNTLPGTPTPPSPTALNKIILLSNRQWWRPVNRHNQ